MNREIGTEISKRIRENDEKAFEIVFHAWYASLVRFCNEYVLEVETARNIAQSVYMKLWERRHLIDENASLKAFLYTMARNECLSYLKHLKAEAKFFKNSTGRFADQMLAFDALNELDFARIDLDKIEIMVEQTVAALPDRCREVFVMSRYHNLKNREIAEQLGITVKAVEANLTRALKTLKENLKDYGPFIFFFF